MKLSCAIAAACIVFANAVEGAGAQTHGPVPVFISNAGQWTASIEFGMKLGPLLVGIDRAGLTLHESVRQDDGSYQRIAVRVDLMPAPSEPTLRGESPRSEVYNFLVGNDPDLWGLGARAYESLVYSSGDPDSELRLVWDGGLRLRGGDPSWKLELPDCSHVDKDSELWRQLRSLQGPPGAVTSERAGAVSAIVVDHAGMDWSTYLGGSGPEHGVSDAVVLEDGGVIVLGATGSFDFPTNAGAFDDSYAGGAGSFEQDVFVARLASNGSQVIWATFLGGHLNDDAYAMLLEPDESVVIAGSTPSLDFPSTEGAFQRTMGPLGALYVLRLAAGGDALHFSTFLGGSSFEQGSAFSKTPVGDYVLAGSTRSVDFPTTPDAAQVESNAIGIYNDGFVSVLSANGEHLVYSSFLGGSSDDSCSAVACSSQGTIYVGGITYSLDFPISMHVFQPFKKSSSDGFVSSIDLKSGQLLASTYFGSDDLDALADLAIDSKGLVVVAGITLAQMPTTPRAWDPTWNGFYDGYVARLSPDLEQLVYGTMFGGNRFEGIGRMVLESSDAVVLSGGTTSTNLPTTQGSFQPGKKTPFGDTDLFVCRLSPEGDELLYSTYLGGTGSESGVGNRLGLATDALGAASVASLSLSSDFPTTSGAFATDLAGTQDVAVARLTLLPEGVATLGASTPGCEGPLTLGVLGIPAVGNGSFGFTCTNAPAFSSRGVLAISMAPGDGSVLAGAAAFIDMSSLLKVLPLDSNHAGYARRPIRIPPDPALAGLHVFAQAFWQDDCAPGNVSASHALELTVQP